MTPFSRLLVSFRAWCAVGLTWAALLVVAQPAAAQVPHPDSVAVPSVLIPLVSKSAAGELDSDTRQRKRRLRLLVGGSALGYGVVYTGLTTAWYTGERVPLHWFND